MDEKPILELLFAEDVEFCEKIPWRPTAPSVS